MLDFPVLNSLTTADRLNRDCFCITLDRESLGASIAEASGRDLPVTGHEHLFANVPMFVSARAFALMTEMVTAIEAAAATPAYLAEMAARSPSIALLDPGPLGAFMGYDFHLSGDMPSLIEVNTNAGGAALNAQLLGAQNPCCSEVRRQIAGGDVSFDAKVAEMFVAEFQRQRGSGRPRRIAIVDDAPDSQFLYPEFLIFAQILNKAGIETVVADPAQLSFHDGALLHDGRPVDLIYNRLVDFMLEQPEHRAIREAYETGAAVVTPNPHLHARLADKRNLVLLSDAQFVAGLNLPAAMAEGLGNIPRTVAVTPDAAETLWATRKEWFFKPVSGHGSKAVYRGDKLTRGVWAEIIKGGYVAQKFAPAGERMIRLREGDVPRKADIRLYTYAGRPLLAAARLYQGQTTNFRSEGGGFAPVFRV